jgi:hypothetical protein
MQMNAEGRVMGIVVGVFLLGSANTLSESKGLSFDSTVVAKEKGLSFDRGEAQKTERVDYHGKLFDGGNMSLVAVAVGSAEGTRTPSAGFTSAYSGHTDPGNRVWNRGTFSYQHSATSPEDADSKQLKRLKTQYEQVLWWAKEYKLPEFTLEEALNAIDLANQSPKAAIDDGGFAMRMAEAIEKGLTGYDRILYARVTSYINPNTGLWEASGLGNSKERVVADQARRMDMIRATMDTYATF